MNITGCMEINANHMHASVIMKIAYNMTPVLYITSSIPSYITYSGGYIASYMPCNQAKSLY